MTTRFGTRKIGLLSTELGTPREEQNYSSTLDLSVSCPQDTQLEMWVRQVGTQVSTSGESLGWRQNVGVSQ